MIAAPRADASAAGSLARALAEVDYTEEAVTELLGDEAYSAGPADVPVHLRRLDESPLSLAVRALFLGLPLARGDVVEALGEPAADALAALGLADLRGEVVPLARVLPVGELLLAADGFSRGDDDPPDYVAAYTPTSRLLDSLTPRRRVGRALDVGTGGGVQALRAAAHAREVVATDVNPRALAFARLNAALNDVDNVDFREGSLFEPVEGEEFDLVLCNAPFVVSPEDRWAYRDSGEPADELSERVVRGAVERLADGGHAAVLVSWVSPEEDEPDARVLDWVAGSGCDAWILPAWEHDPLEHAAEWNEHLAEDRFAYEAALDRWTDHFEALGIRWITEGAVLLHRRDGRTSVRVDEVDEDEVEDASEQVVRAFEARARLARLRSPDALLAARLAPAVELQVERELGPRGRRKRGSVTVTGTGTTVTASDAGLAALEALDGTKRLRDAIGRAKRRDAVRLARELLELGGLAFRS